MMRILGITAAGGGCGRGFSRSGSIAFLKDLECPSCTSFYLLFYKHVLSNGSPDGGPTGYVCRGALARSHIRGT